MATRIRNRANVTKSTGLDVAGIVCIHRAAEMTPKGRREVAAWLRKTADGLVKEGDNYAARFTARYFYKKTKPTKKTSKQ